MPDEALERLEALRGQDVRYVSWSEFEMDAPELAEIGRAVLVRDGIRQGLLATVRGAEPPRIHPVYADIVDGRLYTFLLRSAKRADLEQDGRYALHAHQDPSVPTEFIVRGRARRVDDPTLRAAAAAAWSFEIDDSYTLFELSIESALVGLRDSADEWPPRYRSWSCNGSQEDTVSGQVPLPGR